MNFSILKVFRRDKEWSLLLIVGGLFYLSTALSNSFVNIYIWKQSGELLNIALYNLAMVCVQPIAFYVAGMLTKKIDRVVVLRIGVSILSLFYLLVVLFGAEVNNHLLLLGGMLGAGLGFYWLAFNVLTFEVTEPNTRDAFNGYLGVLSSLAGMMGPFASGLIISVFSQKAGYPFIFGFSLFLFFLAVGLSFLLSKRTSEGSYCIGVVWRLRKVNHQWRKVLHAHFFQGIREGTFVFLIVIWVFMLTESELALGTFGLLQSAVSFIAYFLVSRFITPSRRTRAMLVGGLCLLVSTFIFWLPVTYALLLGYGALVSAAYPLLLVPYASLTYDVIGRAEEAGPRRVEYVVVREWFLNAGRIVSILVFISGITLFTSDDSIPILLPILGAGHFFIFLCVRHITFLHGAGQPVDRHASENNADKEDGTKV
ncbi:MFS superfamily transporter protein [Fictibacillus macauensis ZFHKF-1]|uniref:MFS superfamily transporter protein n=1 Tax=Fictibacillus macauensis ZFHKF-1 TaxID=1196324 RepID=I8AI87_9BACL|nr:MFS transporter [Fictibacillus macauensis]EIT85179.1 MFS superfamily transporter protein [Fictibacillus macauensis ZFHKF-1]